MHLGRFPCMQRAQQFVLRIALEKCSSFKLILDACTHAGRGGVGIHFDVERFITNTVKSG